MTFDMYIKIMCFASHQYGDIVEDSTRSNAFLERDCYGVTLKNQDTPRSKAACLELGPYACCGYIASYIRDKGPENDDLFRYPYHHRSTPSLRIIYATIR